MKRGSILLIGFLVLLIWIPLAAADGSWSIDLVAGQHTTIGTIEINITGDTLTATFQATSPGWCMSTTHFYVSDNAPSRSAPGQFQYKHEGLDCVTTDVFSVPVPEGDVFVSAHADTHFTPGTYEVEEEPADPLTGTASMVASGGDDSYLTVDVTGGINGSYNSWCIDLDTTIYTGAEYTADVYEAVSAPDFLTEVPENLDLVTYIINQDYSGIGASVYDVQLAIWELIEAESFALTPAAQAIVDDALANGADFVPGCGDVIGVVVDPFSNELGDGQHLLLEYPAPCTQTVEVGGSARSETAWALADWGIEFNTGWGMYFQLVDVPDEEPPAPTEPPPAPTEPPPADNGNRARNDEAPGQDSSNDAPGSRRDEANGQQGNNGNGNNGNNGNGNNRNGRGNN